jgi:hypothetical protein
MRAQTFVDLLTDLHRSLDRVADDLTPDRPDLAAALRRQSAWIPRPETVATAPAPRSTTAACAALPPLLYEALDEGVIDARTFDKLMIRRLRALDRKR